MSNVFWKDQYREKSQSMDPLAQAGRDVRVGAIPLLHRIHTVIERLQVEPEDTVIDIGCANGLVDIVLSSTCKSLIAVDVVPEQCALAQINLASYSNVTVLQGSATNIPAADHSADRILMLEALQYLDVNEYMVAFAEIMRIAAPGALALIGSVPDNAKKAAFLEPYLMELRSAGHLSSAQKAAAIARNENCRWYDQQELLDAWLQLGAKPTILSIPSTDPVADHRFDLLVQL